MRSGRPAPSMAPGEEALAAAHVADLERLSEQYAARLSAFTHEVQRELTAVRQRYVGVLVRIVAEFEKERALSVARFQVSREHLRRGGDVQGRQRS